MNKVVTNDGAAMGRHVRATFTLPADVIAALDAAWRTHTNSDGTFVQKKATTLLILIRRNATPNAGRGKPNGTSRRNAD
jgi:hypothetical protein